MTTINGVTFNLQNLSIVSSHRNVISEQPGSDENYITDMGHDGLIIRLNGYETSLTTYDSVISEFMKSGGQTLVHRTGWQYTVYSTQLNPILVEGINDNYFPYDLTLLTSTPYRESTTLDCRAKEITTNNQEWSAGDYPCSNILENWNFDNWSSGTTSVPDNWVGYIILSYARDTLHKVGTYSAKLYSNTNSAHIYQSVSLDYVGKTLTFGCWVYTANANDIKISLIDDTGTTYSSQNSVGGEWEWLTVTRTIDSGTAYIRVGVFYPDTPVFGWFDGAALVEGDSIQDYLSNIDTDGSVDALPDIQVTGGDYYTISQTEKCV